MKNQIRYATFSKRLLSHNIDLIPILLLLYLTTVLPYKDLDIYLMGIIYITYNVAFELSPMRATPGKKMTGIYVKCLNPKTEFFKIILRNGLKPISLIIFFMGFLMIQLTPRRQALHDYIAGTIVLFKEE